MVANLEARARDDKGLGEGGKAIATVADPLGTHDLAGLGRFT
jgi:hypothetical protein